MPRSLALLSCLAVVLGTCSADAEGPARTDFHGDALPAGAHARLGTTRFRAQDSSDHFLLSPDERTFALQDRCGVSLMNARTGRIRHTLRDQILLDSPTSFSAESRLIATKGSYDGRLHVWDTASGRHLWSAPHARQQPLHAVFAVDGKTLVSWGHKDGAYVWERTSGKLLHRLPPVSEGVYRLAITRDGRLLAAPLDRRTVALWDLSTGKKLRTLPRRDDDVIDLHFFPDGRRLACWYKTQDTVRLWDVETGKEALLQGAANRTGWPQIAPDGKTLLGFGASGGPLYGWDTVTGKELWCLPRPKYWQPLLVSPDSRTFALVEKCAIVLGDLRSGERIRSLQGHLIDSPSGRCPFRFSADGSRLIARDANTLRSWDTRTGKEHGRPAGHRMPPCRMAASADGRRVAVADGNQILVWETESGKVVQTWPAQGEAPDSFEVALSRDGRLAATVSSDWNIPVRVWDVKALRERYSIVRPEQDVILAFSRTGDRLAVAFRGRPGVDLRDAASGKKCAAIVQPERDVVDLAFSSDGRTLAVATRVSTEGEKEAPEVRLWDAATGTAAAPWPLPGCGRILFSCDDRLLAIIAANPHPREADRGSVWELVSGKKIARIRLDHHSTPESKLAFTPSGRLVAAVIVHDRHRPWLDNELEVWDELEGKKLRGLRLPGSHFVHVELAPRARWVLTSMADTSVLVWEPSVLSAEKPPPPAQLRAEDLARLWQELAGVDAERAQKAVRVLTAAEAAIPFLEGRLHPVKGGPFLRLIADLDADEYSVRETASGELARWGADAVPALRAALRGEPTLELRRRVEVLLRRVENCPPPPEMLRQVRAVQVLEQVGSPAARRLLAKLAGGTPACRLTEEARAALERLAGQPLTRP